MMRMLRSKQLLAVVGLVVIVTGIVVHADIPVVGIGVFLLLLGVAPRRGGVSRRSAAYGESALVGGLLAILGVSCILLPLVLALRGDFALAAITVPTILIGPYFGFLGYVLLWTSLVGTDPPLARRAGVFMGRVAAVMSRRI